MWLQVSFVCCVESTFNKAGGEGERRGTECPDLAHVACWGEMHHHIISQPLQEGIQRLLLDAEARLGFLEGVYLELHRQCSV